MTVTEIKVYWYYFRSIATQLYRTEQFVDHALNDKGEMENGTSFSNEFAKILLLSASEFEVIARALCQESRVSLPSNSNILQITQKLISVYPKIGATVIRTPYCSLEPLKDWKVVQKKNCNGKNEDVVDGIQWWGDHNGLKHNRLQMLASANLKNCVEATAALMVLELYLSQKVLGNVNEITSLGCDYFSCDYGSKYMEADTGKYLPDFV